MAARHYVPKFRSSDVGIDAQAPLRRFRKPVTVEFGAGKDLSDFISEIRQNPIIRVSAAAGAGKSVRMPTALVSAFGGVVVHCVPSLLLATSLYDYVSSVSTKEVPCHLLGEIVDDYPEEGIVYTSSAVFVGQVCRWASLGVDPGVILYMDECHESDAGTCVIRDCSLNLHGVSKYLEASATFGSGDQSTAFSVPRLPSTVTTYKYDFPDSDKWDVEASKVPWSLDNSDGDMLVFIDDPMKAAKLSSAYKNAGYNSYVLCGRTPIHEFRRIMKEMDNFNKRKEITVLIVDYVFRSGFTFPTVSRIIDTCVVRFPVSENGRTVHRERNAFNFEVYQATNRGGRVAGRNCDYWRPKRDPANVEVLAEGVEAEMVCIYMRMLGFAVKDYYRGTQFATGLVPEHMLLAMCGPEALSNFVCRSEWPAEKRVERSVVQSPLRELSPPSPVAESFVSAVPMTDSLPAAVATPEFPSLGRPPSVFTLYDDFADVSVLDVEEFAEGRKRTMKRKEEEKRDRVPPDRHERLHHNIADLRKSWVRSSSFLELDDGTYYRAHEGWYVNGVRYFPKGVASVLASCGGRPVGQFLDSLDHNYRHEAFSRALDEFNSAVVMDRGVSATVNVLKRFGDQLGSLDVTALGEWLSMASSMSVNARSNIASAKLILSQAPAGYLAVDTSSYSEREVSISQLLIASLNYCTPNASGLVTGIPQGDVYVEDAVRFSEFVDNSPLVQRRMMMRINGKSLRERLAAMLIGKRTLTIDTAEMFA